MVNTQTAAAITETPTSAIPTLRTARTLTQLRWDLSNASRRSPPRASLHSMDPLAQDTSPSQIEEYQRRLRELGSLGRIRAMNEASTLMRQVALAGIKARYPRATGEKGHRRVERYSGLGGGSAFSAA